MMDNPNVSISDLFANVRTSSKKYEARQKLAKQQRERKRQVQAAHGGKAIAKPLFASRLLIESSNSNIKETSPLNVSSNYQEENMFSSTRRAHVYQRRVSSLESSSFETKENEASCGGELHKKPSVPEYIPLCERRRRAEAETILRSKSSQLTNHNNGMNCSGATDMPSFKPLMWNKPSFTLVGQSPSSTPNVTDISYSSSPRLGKRKALLVDDTNTNPFSRSSITSNPLLGDVNAITPMPTSSGALSSSSIGVYRRNYNPTYKHKWAKEEVDSLVDFADKWMTPDVKK